MKAVHLKSMSPGVAIVTGGSKRIGKSIIRKLSSLGWKVIIHYNSNKIDALSLQKEIQKNGGSASIIKANLNNPKATKELISKSAGLAYPIKNGIPIMLAKEARLLN